MTYAARVSPVGWIRLLLLLCILFSLSRADHDPKREPKKVISLAKSMQITQRSLQDPSVEEIRKQYWRKALEDIRNMSAFGSSSRKSPGSDWKRGFVQSTTIRAARGASPTNGTTTSVDILENVNLTLAVPVDANKRQRFEGFLSWDRLLQEWSDEVQEHLLQVEKETADYSLGNFGRARPEEHVAAAVDDTVTTEEPTPLVPLDASSEMTHSPSQPTPTTSEPDVSSKTISPPVNGSSRKERTLLPVPAPAQPGEAVLPHTDLSDLSKRVEIVTTASLPWRTGTAVNPLLRAAYLTEGRKGAGGSVTLTLPWLERRVDQETVYGRNQAFESPADQEAYIRTWLRDTAAMPEAANDLRIRWYKAWYVPVENSVYSMGDIIALIPADEVDICILEEPEHLNWYRAPGESWTKKFPHVVGILHTNYFQYAMDQPAAIIRAPAMRLLCSWMCRAHCHRIIKLSGTLDKTAPEKELVENVHGVRGTFIDTGIELRKKLQASSSTSDPVFAPDATPTIYFIGKMLWSKGLGSLMELLKYAEESAEVKVKVDMYGGGPDNDAAAAKARKLGLDMPFHGPVDHAELSFSHKIFVNPSTSEVLCTTSAEALAMGKFVIIPSHVSNDFFAQFPNCLTYTTKDEFLGSLFYAMTHSPEPLSDEYSHALTWKAATERLVRATAVTAEEAKQREAALLDDAGIDITLPPLLESEEGRKLLSTTLRFTRDRYRQFRSRLSNEIMQNKVLPQSVKERLAADLDSRLDFDIDEILDSPKLRLKISPAELDKSLLELYDQLTRGPGGDVLRLVGGGGQVGLQNLYMRQQAKKQQARTGTLPDPVPFYLMDTEPEDGAKSLAGGIRGVLRQNLPSDMLSAFRNGVISDDPHTSSLTGKPTSIATSDKNSPKMAASHTFQANSPRIASVRPSQFTSRNPFSLLI